jgi:hypothetical protein
MIDNRIRLDRGYLVNIEVLDFPIVYWCKELISATFYPFGPKGITFKLISVAFYPFGP